ncbi:MAG TPA: hypothetical protein VEB59_11050 [Gemmatimonadales bacterium]|nr:hypothetical protein [Gemmatimonadales bacterium]
MCYFLTMASPLTLSEVRSMLPAGLTANLVGTAETAAARVVLPATQTVAELLAGACSCDLVRPRLPDQREDERHLRARFARLGLGRDEIIRRLERHRRRPSTAVVAGPAALADFVAEHARNAGPTLYALRFGEAGGPLAGPAITCPLERVRRLPDAWLEEGRALLVVRP